MISKKRFLIKRFVDDSIGLTIFEALKTKKKNIIPKKPKEIIIFKLSAIGDSILTLNPIKKLKEKTKAKIIIACSSSNKIVFENQNFIDEIVLVDATGNNIFNILRKLNYLKRKKADLAIDLSHTGKISAIWAKIIGKSCIGFYNEEQPKRKGFYDFEYKMDLNKHMIFNYYNLFNYFKISFDLNLLKVKFPKIRIKELENKKNLVGIHPAHEIEEKSWNKNKFAKIINFIIENKKIPVILGSKKELKAVLEILDLVKEKNKVINLAGKLNLNETFNAMENFDFFIANDGGLMHAAASMDLPTLGIFNVETPMRYAPFNKNSYSVHKDYISVEEVKEIIKNYFL